MTSAQQLEMLSRTAQKDVDENAKLFGWTKGNFRNRWVLVQHGPINSTVFRRKRGIEVDSVFIENISNRLSRPGQQKNEDEESILEKNNVEVTIQGVAWDFPPDEPCPIRLLNPIFWPKAKTTSRRKNTIHKYKDEISVTY